MRYGHTLRVSGRMEGGGPGCACAGEQSRQFSILDVYKGFAYRKSPEVAA